MEKRQSPSRENRPPRETERIGHPVNRRIDKDSL